VLGGALAFGLLGIFLGPVLLGVGFTLVAEFSGDQRLPAEQLMGFRRHAPDRPRLPEAVSDGEP
jgi:predicted PurR-regulated permease PerM